VTPAPGLDLGRPRDVGELFRDSVVLYARHFGLLLLIAVAVVAPVQMVVSGIGLEELTSAYREDSSLARTGIPAAVSFLVTAPLITAATIFALGSLADGVQPRAGRSLQEALDVFAPLFAAVVLAAAGIALGLLAVVIPGVYLAVRWYFVTQTVVIDGLRGREALARSWDVVQDSFWRTFAILLLANLATAVPGILILSPLAAAAEAANREAVLLVGEIVAECLTTPFIALVTTLLFYDLRARKASVAAVD
jgi:multisubunit Na+/H+ antiporter MnhC subunit